MKKIKNVLFTFLTLCLSFAMMNNVKALDYGFYSIYAEKNEVVADISIYDVKDEFQSVFDGEIRYSNKEGIELNNFKGERLELERLNGYLEDSFYIDLSGVNKVNRLYIASISPVYFTGDGVISFVPFKWARTEDNRNTSVPITDVEEQKQWVEKRLKNLDELNVTYENGYVIVSCSNVPNYLESVTSENGFVFMGGKAFYPYYHLYAEEVEYPDDKKESLKKYGNLLQVFDIKMLNELTNDYDDMKNGDTYTIKIPMSEEMKKYKKFKVLYLVGDQVEEMTTSTDGDYVVFETTHLSEYAVMGLTDTNEAVNAPNTFDGVTNSIILGMIALIAVGGVTLFLRKKVNEM